MSDCLNEYIRKGDQNEELWSLFRQDFSRINNKEIFASIKLRIKQKLRNHLRFSGVYVQPITRITSIDEALIEVIDEPKAHTWTKQDLDEMIQGQTFDIEDVKSKWLAKQLRNRITEQEQHQLHTADDQPQAFSTPATRRTVNPFQTPLTPGNRYSRQETPTPNPRVHFDDQPARRFEYGPQDVRGIPSGDQPASGIRPRDQSSYVPQPCIQPPNQRSQPGVQYETPSHPIREDRGAPQDYRNQGLGPQEIQPAQPSAQPTKYYGKEIAELTKMITDGMKYSGCSINESLDQKMTVYDSIFRRLNPPEEVYSRAFPVMLKGVAQDYYYNNRLETLPVDQICDRLKRFFEGPGFHRRNLDKWNETSLRTVANETENTTKSTQECLKILINRLQELQYGLAPDLRSEGFLHAKLISSYIGIPSCKYTISDLSEGLDNLTSKLYSSIINYEKEQALVDDGYGPQPPLRAHITESFPSTSFGDSRDLELDHAYYTGRRYYQRHGRRDEREPRQGSN